MDENLARQQRLRRIAYSAFGLLPLFFGVCIIVYIFAFASMVNPRLAENERRALVFRKMLLGPELVPVLFGLVLIIAGVCILLSGIVPLFADSPRSIMASRGAITLSAIVLALIAMLLFALG